MVEATLTGADGLYLTTADKAWEVNFDTQYKIYKDLTLAVEIGYINLDLEKGVWVRRLTTTRKTSPAAL